MPTALAALSALSLLLGACTVSDLSAVGRPCGDNAACGPGARCDTRLAICVESGASSSDGAPDHASAPDTFIVPDGGCPAGYTQCGGACAKLTSDPKHCGGCNKACTGVTDRCVNSSCVCGATGGPCGAGLDCVKGSCQCVAGGSCSGCCDGEVCRPLGSLTASKCGQGGAACKSCDDGKACTTDSCSATGSCGSTPISSGGSCDDADDCTHSDTCSGGVCKGTPFSCSDGLSCTTDTCTGKAPPAQCNHTLNAGHCLIQKQCFVEGASSGADPCDACRTTRSTSAWSLAKGCVGTLAGTGVAGHKDGPVTSAQFDTPADVAVDGKGVIYVADRDSDVIRSIAAGVVSTVAGQPNLSGFLDGPAASSLLSSPYGVAADASGKVYVADRNNDRIRLVSGNTVSTLAGTGAGGFKDGPALSAQFKSPRSVAVAAGGTLVIADTSNHCIRQLASGVVSTLAGACGLSGKVDGAAATARFSGPRYVAVDSSGKVYVGDTNNDVVRMISGGVVSTLAGSGVGGFKDGSAATAQFDNPVGLAVTATGTVFVADWRNARVRAISPAGVVSTLAGDGVDGYVDGPAAKARFSDPYGLALDQNGDLIVAERGNPVVRIIAR